MGKKYETSCLLVIARRPFTPVAPHLSALMQLNPEDLIRKDDTPLLESVAIVTFATHVDHMIGGETLASLFFMSLLLWAESPLTDPLCIHEVLSLPGHLNSLGALRF